MAIIMNDSNVESDFVNDINMTPLIDVMLVLLIVFIITLPVINQAVKVTLPQASAQAAKANVKDIDLSITSDGTVSWDRQPVDDSELSARIANAANVADAPAVNIYADENVRYGRVAKVLASVEAGGLTKINFVTDPVKDSK
ncbi:biopolymer transporter ExbD [Pandoraea thiooxydans]|uniref:Biopolymer transporter ExbD n=1 Tax=Pandoraea thiooxydans TaxID=445709 RepID=A0A0G3EPM8_9BURK|nr:biopolymer transporter ExbD [Pandoraea thiooxydans]AKJ67297.1 biopolymer transporter ExbD [Pandoraea thiooxydans]